MGQKITPPQPIHISEKVLNFSSPQAHTEKFDGILAAVLRSEWGVDAGGLDKVSSFAFYSVHISFKFKSNYVHKSNPNLDPDTPEKVAVC